MRFILFFIIFSSHILAGDLLTARGAVETALEKNPEYLRSKLNVDIARFQKWEATSNMFPTFSAGITQIRNDKAILFPIDSTTSATIQPLNMGQFSFDASVPLYTGGALRSAQKIASTSYDISGLMLNENRENIKLKVLRAYYNVIKMDGILSISLAAGELVNENVKMVNRMFDLGMMQKRDILRAKVSSSEIRQQIQQAEQGLRLSNISLNLVLGESFEKNYELEKDIPSPILKQNLDELMQYAMSNRPALVSARKGIDAAEYGVKAAKGFYMPNVAAVWHWQQDTEASLMGSDQSWRAILNVSYELPFGSPKVARLESAKAMVRQSKYSEMEAENGIRLEIEANYLQYQLMENTLALADEQVGAAKENYEAVVSGMELGESSQIELIDARNTLFNSQINQINIKIDHYLSYQQLLVSCGYPVDL
ncbi:MAG: TolC family protein [Candidatus Marinimicrobia bacterium]|nr:TolC family protein [Candidatus Neomarinimicrobiota bacterium]